MRSAPSILIVLLLAGCGPRETVVRRYREIDPPPPAPAPSAAEPSPAAGQAVPMGDHDLKIAWTTPEGWTEAPGAAMRIATFRVGASECTLVAFPGDVGGLEANLGRWLGQLNVEATPERLAALTAAAQPLRTTAGWEGRWFDFAPVLPPGAASSMLAALVPVEGRTLFVKLTGAPAALAAARRDVEAALADLRRGGPLFGYARDRAEAFLQSVQP